MENSPAGFANFCGATSTVRSMVQTDNGQTDGERGVVQIWLKNRTYQAAFVAGSIKVGR